MAYPVGTTFLSMFSHRAGGWLRDFNVAAACPGFSIAGYLAKLQSR